MRPIIKIAKNELQNLFYSPVAWFTMIVFFSMCGYYYSSASYIITKGFNEEYLYNPYADLVYKTNAVSMTSQVFPGFFTSILQYLYLYVPLITMGIISREFNSGTVKLLYSSPVTLRQVVIGKYLGLMLYNLVYVFILGIFIIEGFIDIKSLDYGALLSATFGIYLLLCALSAIGFFMSSLTTYQVVSAIASFTVLFVLRAIGSLWQQYDFVREITYFLSINNRTEWMINGLIRSKDVIYYLVIIYLFVGFTVLKLRAGREAIPWYFKMGRCAVVIVVGLLVGYAGSRPRFTGYLDVTERKINTIRPETQKALGELRDSALEVTVYTNLLDRSNNGINVLPSNRKIFEDQWEQYVRFKPGIKFRYEYYYNVLPADSFYYKLYPGKTLAQIAGLVARGNQLDVTMFKSPEEMNKIIDLGPEGYLPVMQLKYGKCETFLRAMPLAFSEYEAILNQTVLNAAFKRLSGAKIPKLSFITGELERSINKKGEREFSSQYALINFGFDFDTTNLATHDLAPDITTVVLADPKMNLRPTVLHKLKDYLNKGGNMLIMGEPKKQYVLNPLLQQLGVQLMPGQLVQPNANETPDKVTSYYTPTYFDLANDYWFRYIKLLWSYNAYFEDLAKFEMTGVVPLAVTNDSGFMIKPLLLTKPWTSASPKPVWLKPGKLVTDSLPPVFNVQEGDIKLDSFATALQLTRQVKGKEQRIIVCGDADLASNIYAAGPSERLYSWLNYNGFPVYTPIPFPPKDNKMRISTKWAALQKIVYAWVIPGILLVLGAALLTRRKRK